MSKVIPFSFDGNAVRVLSRDGEPWFVLADVCGVLEHTNSRVVAERLDEDEKGVSNVYTLGGLQEMSIINESGLYNLIFTSRKPEARRFRKWVTGEVLPAIRKTGSYGLPTRPQEWFTLFARILCLWDTLGEDAARKDWQTFGPLFPMPRKQAVRMLMEAALDLPPGVLPNEPAGQRQSTPATRNPHQLPPQRITRRPTPQRRKFPTGRSPPLPYGGERSHPLPRRLKRRGGHLCNTREGLGPLFLLAPKLLCGRTAERYLSKGAFKCRSF